MTPGWLLDLLAAIMLTASAASVLRLAATAPSRHPLRVAADADVAHALMGIAMAGMLTARLATLPDAAWAVVFALLTAWFAGRAWRQARAGRPAGRCRLHAVHCAAMLYMVLALAAPALGGAGLGGLGGTGGMERTGPAMATLHYPTLAAIFAAVIVGACVRDLDHLSARRAGGPATPAASGPAAARAIATAPVTQAGRLVIIGITMAFMLITMI